MILKKNLLLIRSKLGQNKKIGGLEAAKSVAAIEILKSSLNFDQGGEIAKNLLQIYLLLVQAVAEMEFRVLEDLQSQVQTAVAPQEAQDLLGRLAPQAVPVELKQQEVQEDQAQKMVLQELVLVAVMVEAVFFLLTAAAAAAAAADILAAVEPVQDLLEMVLQAVEVQALR